MDVLLATKAAVRRWYVSGPVLLLTAIIAALSFFTAQSAWQTSGSLVIVQPLAPSGSAVDEGGTRLMATLLADNYNSDVVQANLAAKGAIGVFQAKASTELPLVGVKVEARSAGAAAATLKITLDNGDAVLADLQRRLGKNKADFYRSARSVADSSPKFSASSRLVGVIGILVGGAAIAILLSAIVDGLLTRRRADDPAPGGVRSPDYPRPSDTPDRARVPHSDNTNGGVRTRSGHSPEPPGVADSVLLKLRARTPNGASASMTRSEGLPEPETCRRPVPAPRSAGPRDPAQPTSEASAPRPPDPDQGNETQPTIDENQ